MNKILAALVATVVSAGAFAQATAPAPAASGAMSTEKSGAPMADKKSDSGMKKHHTMKKHHDKKPMEAAASKPAA